MIITFWDIIVMPMKNKIRAPDWRLKLRDVSESRFKMPE